MVIPLRDCIARPDQAGQRFPLVDHLIAVASACGRPDGDPDSRLGFLAGLLHDAGKCHVAWDEYIRGGRNKGPPHAPMGAALFTFAAERLIAVWAEDRSERKTYINLMLDWSLLVHCHHRPILDLDANWPPWDSVAAPVTVAQLVPGCDLSGIFDLVRRYFTDFSGLPEQFLPWLESYPDRWAKHVQNVRSLYVQKCGLPAHRLAIRLPEVASRLIFADRGHAARFVDARLGRRAATAAVRQHQRFCAQREREAIQGGANPALVQARARVQQEAVSKYLRHSDQHFYTLLLPTGYGKTLTALRVALQACSTGRCSRIIYVAPYISILSQAAYEIERATGQHVFQHHHLSLAQITEPSQLRLSVEQLRTELEERADDHDTSPLDTWQSPIVATTFNQFFRALFPQRPQETLRIPALRDAFLIIDEPQIIDTAIWNVFLRTLEAAAEQWDFHVLFSTATLPLLDDGLSRDPVRLESPVPSLQRYRIRYHEQLFGLSNMIQLTADVLKNLPNLAVVMNSVRDAVLVYRALRESLEGGVKVYCLTAMMLPGHKKAVINRIGMRLEAQKTPKDGSSPKVVVVCTQILEAGVDLSFRAILRALPILPSIAQVAGRANRHGEAAQAGVDVFRFAVEDAQESRGWVYRDRTACRVTDRILQNSGRISEDRMTALLEEYFQACRRENDQKAGLAWFEAAARGQWSALAGAEPFGAGPPREEVFVPSRKAPLTPPARRLVERFAPDGPHQLWERFFDKSYRHGLSFQQRKLLTLALRQYIVPAAPEVTAHIAQRVNHWLWKIDHVKHYSAKTGLAHWLAGEETGSSHTII